MEPSISEDDLGFFLDSSTGTPQQFQNFFSQFHTHTQELLKAYKQLEIKCLEVSKDLAYSQSQLIHEVVELTRTRFYLQALVDHMAEGLLFIEKDGRVSTSTPKALELLGLPAGKPHQSYLDLFDDNFLGFSIKQALSQRIQPPTCILTLSSPNPQHGLRYLKICPSYIDLENRALSKRVRERHAVQGLLILITDITEFQRLQETNQRNQRLKEIGEVAASLAHEIRNPLAAINGFAALLIKDLKDTPSASMAHSIVEASRLLNRYVDHVLQYARPVTAKLQRQDLVQTIQASIEAIKVSDYLQKSQLLDFQLPAQPVLIEHDHELMQSCLMHLIRNALQAISEQGSVKVALQLTSHEVWIEVQDNGVGIAPENLQKVFQPFFTTKSEGNGLGLCEVNKMIQAQGGRIEVSSSLGVGSVFTLKLPLHSPLTRAC